MLSCSEVMIAGESDHFLGAVADALHEAGALVVCVSDTDSAVQAIDDGFRPDAVVVDGALDCGPDLVARVTARRRRAGVVAAAPLRSPDQFQGRRVTVVRRYDVAGSSRRSPNSADVSPADLGAERRPAMSTNPLTTRLCS